MTDLCLTLSEPSTSELQEKMARYAGKAAWIEARLDALEAGGRLPRPPQGTGTSFIATCRPLREGGAFAGEERSRLEILAQAASNGFSWVDLEHDVEVAPPMPPSTRIIRSRHYFQGQPESLEREVRMLGRRGDLAKLAITIRATEELARLLAFMEQLPDSVPRVILGMGELGQPSRFLGPFLGNRWTYLCEDPSSPAAPGQFTLREAIETYRLDFRQTAPLLYGLIGRPVSHSRSPFLHNRLFALHGLESLYLPCPLDDPAPWFDYLDGSRLRFGGFSVTLPFKTRMGPFLGSDEPAASLHDPINTLVRERDRWRGENTDYQGFLKPLQRRWDELRGLRAVVLGSGGVAGTVARALRDQGCDVVLAGRSLDRVKELASRLGCSALGLGVPRFEADLCVNATPVGQHPHIEDAPLRPTQMGFRLVYDLVYNPRRTRLLEHAQALGIPTISGLEMFVEQAACQFLLWTGIDPDRRFIEELLAGSGPIAS